MNDDAGGCESDKERESTDGLPPISIGKGNYDRSWEDPAKMLSLLPHTGILSKDSISNIIFHIPNVHPKVKLAILKFLNGVHDYNICDRSAFNSYVLANCIFRAGRTDDIIPWICSMMQKIATKNNIRKCMINDLLDLLQVPINHEAKKHVVELLRYYKRLRPDLLPRNFHRKGFNVRKPDLGAEFSRALIEARTRAQADKNDGNLEQMEVDNEVEVTNKMESYLETLNDRCFPEFRLNREEDPDPSDIKSLLKLSCKYDLMRCALKTQETLPFIVNDAETFCHYNTFVSLIFQHRFNSYNKADQRRYDFILKRCLDISVLNETNGTAVDEWIFKFMWTWDTVLFKRFIFELLRYISVVNFKKDNYMIVLQKLETLFMFGEPIDRAQVWSTLTAISLNWIKILLCHSNENDGSDISQEALEYTKNSVEFLLEKMYHLINLAVGVGGHEDEAFLVNCCRSYIRINNLLNEFPQPPFFVYPPYFLWVMVVNSDSIIALDQFCRLITSCRIPKLPSHLKDTRSDSVLIDWKGRTLPGVFQYFDLANKKDTIVQFFTIFEVEFSTAQHVIDEAENLRESTVQSVKETEKVVHKLYEDLSHFSALTSPALSKILKEPRQSTFVESLDNAKAEKFAPFILGFMKFAITKNSSPSKKPPMEL